ncbi:MAG TPA: hypothetical protein VHR66_32425 [Gemmataceae bacterium]|jgi:hypothetical protein|nr:hypothetical protein [Gemmataceae bacterium]
MVNDDGVVNDDGQPDPSLAGLSLAGRANPLPGGPTAYLFDENLRPQVIPAPWGALDPLEWAGAHMVGKDALPPRPECLEPTLKFWPLVDGPGLSSPGQQFVAVLDFRQVIGNPEGGQRFGVVLVQGLPAVMELGVRYKSFVRTSNK